MDMPQVRRRTGGGGANLCPLRRLQPARASAGERRGEMSEYRVTIRTDNAAFEGQDYGHEIARILRSLASDLEAGHRGGQSLRDINGNTVGAASETY